MYCGSTCCFFLTTCSLVLLLPRSLVQHNPLSFFFFRSLFFSHCPPSCSVNYENRISESAIQDFVRWIDDEGFGGNDETYEIVHRLRATTLDDDTDDKLEHQAGREQRDLAALFGFHAASTNSTMLAKPSWLLQRCRETGKKINSRHTNMPQAYAVHTIYPNSLKRLRRSTFVKGVLRSFDQQIAIPFYPINRALIMDVVPPCFRVFPDMPWMQVGKTGGSRKGMNKLHIDRYR